MADLDFKTVLEWMQQQYERQAGVEWDLTLESTDIEGAGVGTVWHEACHAAYWFGVQVRQARDNWRSSMDDYADSLAVDEMCRLRLQGLTWKAIGEHCRCCGSTAARKVRVHWMRFTTPLDKERELDRLGMRGTPTGDTS